MDPSLYRAVMKGDRDVLIRYKDQFDVQLTPKQNNVVHIAAMHGQTQSLKEIFGICPSLLAAMHGQPQSLKEIFGICPSLLRRLNLQGETPFYIAASRGHAGIVQALFDFVDQQNSDPEMGGFSQEMLREKNEDDDTALHVAVRNGHLNVVKLLLEKDPTFQYQPNKAEETPLYLAAKMGFDGIVSEILKTYKSPLYGGPDGRTALHGAIIFGSKGTPPFLNTFNSIIKQLFK